MSEVTKVTPKKNDRQSKFLTKFKDLRGNISSACRAIGISRMTYYRWIEDPTFKTKIDNIQEGVIDWVESKLFGNIEQGREASIFFFLKTRAKHRGYVERQEHTGRDGGPIQTSSMSNQEAAKIYKKIKSEQKG